MNESSKSLDSVDDQVHKAKADAEIAKANAEKVAAEQRIKDQKSKNRAKKVSVVKKLSKGVKAAIVVAAVAIVVVAIAVIPGILNSSRQGITVSKASLKEAVSISKLSTAEFTYNGIAEKTDESGNVSYYIYYEASAKSGVNMDEIDFDIDDANKAITVILPQINVNSPVIDESKIDYLPSNPNVNLREVLELCKADMQQEIEANPNVRNTAEENLKSTLEALLMPILGSDGYSLKWQNSNDVDEGVNYEDSK